MPSAEVVDGNFSLFKNNKNILRTKLDFIDYISLMYFSLHLYKVSGGRWGGVEC